jgi:hypothetical protein
MVVVDGFAEHEHFGGYLQWILQRVRIVTKLNYLGSSRGQSRHRLPPYKIVWRELVLLSMGTESTQSEQWRDDVVI